jgi:glycosyltransferase involved in cell wall biosynthesis
MRVLQVFEPPDGGVPEHVSMLSRGLSERGHEVEVAGPADARIRAKLNEIPYHELTLGRSYANPARDLRAAAQLRAVLRSNRFDRIHAHSSKAGVVGRVAARLEGVPCLYTPHCYGFIGEVSRARERLALTVERRLARLAARTICVCEYERREAIRRGVAPQERLTVVHNGVERCPAAEPNTVLRRFSAGANLVGTLCVHRRQKGVDRLIDAAPGILERRPETRFAIVGNGPLRRANEERARALGLGDRVLFIDFAEPAASYLGAFDVFTLPSRWEAFPIVVLEAMSCGVPVVATDVGGTGEALADGAGRLVRNWSPRDFEIAVVELLDDAAGREALGARAAAKAAKEFSASAMVEATEAVYSAVGDA